MLGDQRPTQSIRTPLCDVSYAPKSRVVYLRMGMLQDMGTSFACQRENLCRKLRGGRIWACSPRACSRCGGEGYPERVWKMNNGSRSSMGLRVYPVGDEESCRSLLSEQMDDNLNTSTPWSEADSPLPASMHVEAVVEARERDL